ncbi:MAG: hypothetical protein JST28_16460 [Acidobacteria bacterium]|nr:hypothetical protein [Acidobacteriota bacterium]
MGLFIYALFHNLSHMTDNLTQIVVPGSARLSLLQGRTYTVFLEEESVVNGKIYSTRESIASLDCHVSSASSGAVIPVQQARTSTTYSFGSRSGRSVLEFKIEQNGTYLFACDYGGIPGPETVLAIGSGIGEAIMLAVVESLGALFGGGRSGARSHRRCVVQAGT